MDGCHWSRDSWGDLQGGDKNSCKFDENEQRQDSIRSVFEGSYLKAPMNLGLTQCRWVSLEARWLGQPPGGCLKVEIFVNKIRRG